ncbi:hypothetical protein [Rhodohalobacter sp. 8-1]|uniref:hypothetical protein n=1 Tax=Rhodohalobacter sp. 8-1 TaxID=3131972 RepID=UPI0030EE272D
MNYDIYSRKNLSISECLPSSGALTADLIVYYNINIDIPENVYDTILVVAINYYAMLYIDIFSGYYSVNKKHTYIQLISLVEEVLRKSNKTKMYVIDDEEALYRSRELSKQAVDIFYRAGPDGCKKFLSVSINSVLLLTGIQQQIINRGQIDTIISGIYSKKLHDDSFSAIYASS